MPDGTLRDRIHCHNCSGYFDIEINTYEDGRHVILCPNCQHEHYRYVYRGRVTDKRWGSNNGPASKSTGNYIQIGTNYTSGTSASNIKFAYNVYDTSSTGCANLWMDITKQTTG